MKLKPLSDRLIVQAMEEEATIVAGTAVAGDWRPTAADATANH